MQDAPVAQDAAGFEPPLDPFLRRAILATDGTVTNLIEEFLEPVAIEKLDERVLGPGAPDGWADLDTGSRVVSREVLIRGQESGRVLLHAESLIVLDSLDDILRCELLETDKPIGKLLRESRRETYRELLGHRTEPAGRLADHFGCEPGQALVARVYRIHLGGRPAIQITERFPDDGVGEERPSGHRRGRPRQGGVEHPGGPGTEHAGGTAHPS